MSVSAPSLSAERAAPAPARWRSICAATVVSAPCCPGLSKLNWWSGKLALPLCAMQLAVPPTA